MAVVADNYKAGEGGCGQLGLYKVMWIYYRCNPRGRLYLLLIAVVAHDIIIIFQLLSQNQATYEHIHIKWIFLFSFDVSVEVMVYYNKILNLLSIFTYSFYSYRVYHLVTKLFWTCGLKILSDGEWQSWSNWRAHTCLKTLALSYNDTITNVSWRNNLHLWAWW